ncbi:hypothetical protein N7489_005724 [Penicillium chrysogenum]|uniref:uncharacterized protein n=1 Tax=Penicillium chrysogenum TaxID=5076 RepID=UPI0023A52CBC|nr:uncharacterized protein N7489_005724 [Penicillium chrysogenum]KAJ5245628.1 hypothetical protein N7489_005724 [Penicillium chrysogenum]KAJ5284749.1 hypothetical protein N7524_000055 [Penicillium chrysogenum]KAJ6155992.1 hypothetical protein N7497_004877 [Penicillium chrysogenum]
MAPPYRNDNFSSSSSRRPFPSRNDHGRMYDDRSRSRSPDRARSPRRLAADGRPEYPRDRESGQGYRNHDRDDYRRRTSRSSPHRGRNTYKDRDREGYRSASGNRSRTRSPRRGQSRMGQVSREVMMDGLPVDMEEEHIATELRNAYHIDGLENIRVIRDRQTRLSRQLGFLRFPTIDASRDFVERNHPFIFFYGPTNDRVTQVRIAYSREREDRARARGASDWNCRTCLVLNFSTRSHCFKCGIPRPDMDSTGPPGASAPKIANEGDNDVAPEGQPSQFLLIRGLAASVTEELLAKGVSKLYRPSGNNDSAPDNQKKGSKVASTTGDSNLGAREGSLRRVLLVRDRRTNESWGYGFAEFAGITDAQAAMARLNSFEKFTISSKPVLVSYIHGGVFVPVMNAPSGASYFTFSPSNNPSLKLMYWDDAAFVTELVVSTEEDDAAQEQRANKTTSNQGDAQAKGMKDSDKGKKRKIDGPASASTKKLAMPSQLQFWSDRHAELHGINRDAAGNPAESSSSVTPATESAPPVIEPAAPAIEPAAPAIEPAAPPAPSFADFDKNRCLLCMQDLVNAGHLRYHERESDIHRENLKDINLRIRGICWMIIYHVIPMPTPNYKDSKDEYREALEREYSVPPTARSFADLKRNCCLLCFTEFDTPEDVLVHDRVSKRHLEQLQDEEAVKEGLDRLKQAGIAQDIKPAAPTAPVAPTAPTVAAAPEYRDRAKERRAAFGRDDANDRQRPAEPEEEDEAPVQTTSIGASLLSKMGWTEGTGLGAQGTGVTEPIPTEIYAQGVGLGAQGGRLGEATEEAGRNTRGRYDEFLEKTRDTARQRYEEMDRS